MAAPVKPFPLQLASISFGEEYFYRLLKALAGEGVVGINDLKVSQRAAGANMSVDVAAGEFFCRFDIPEGGLRHGWLAGVANSGTPGAPNAADGWISTFLAADPTNPRVDRVVLTVRDSALDASGAYDAVLRVIPGAATVGATLANLSGAAAVPANSILLANVLIPAASVTIVDANIDSTLGPVRQYALVGQRGVPAVHTTNSVGQAIPTSTWTTLSHDTDRFDTDNAHVVADLTKLNCRLAGIFLLIASFSVQAHATGYRQARLLLNDVPGPQDNRVSVGAGDSTYVRVASVRELAVGDHVKVQAWQNSGGTLNVEQTVEFSAVKVA